MAKHEKKRRKQTFEFEAIKGRKRSTLREDDTGEDVRAIQTFLMQTGYLAKGHIPGRMCHCTMKAIRHFQKCYKLEDSGEADPNTLELMQRPRCGNPDISGDPARSTGPAPFVLRGCKYNQLELTYAFMNGSPDLPNDLEHDIVRQAFGIWSEVTPLRFAEVDPDDSPMFPISWERGNHGDGSSFDDGGSIMGNTLAHAFFPPTCGGVHAGALHFDEFESWTDQAAPRSIRLLNVSIHEIGHLLGLGHSNLQDAIMFAFYDDNVDSLRQDDINGIQELYGRRQAGTVPIRGVLNGNGDQQVHRLNVPPGRLEVILTGPSNADFDLYVRLGIPPTRSEFDGRGFTSGSQERVVLDIAGGPVFIMADSWRGAGAYQIEVLFGE